MLMKSPKTNTELEDATLNDSIPVKYCAESEGFWLPAREYENWLSRVPAWYARQTETIPHQFMFTDYVPSPFDSKAGLCPECSIYLARAKVNVKNAFYVERCNSCGGIWFDPGEWQILEELKLHIRINTLFSSQWQALARQKQQDMTARQTLIDKLGPEVADYVFQLADILAENPEGDCAAAYILKKFEEARKGLPRQMQT